MNPFKGRLTLQLRIHELSNLIVITVISIFVPFSLFLQIFVLGHLFLQVAVPDYFRSDVAVPNYYFFFANCCTKQIFCKYHTVSFFNALQLFPLCKYQIVHIICFSCKIPFANRHITCDIYVVMSHLASPLAEACMLPWGLSASLHLVRLKKELMKSLGSCPMSISIRSGA